MNGLVVNPAVGFFISDKASIDINFSYVTFSDLKLGNVNSYYKSYAVIPTLRNYFVNKEKLRVFAELGFGIGTIKYFAKKGEFINVQHTNLSGGMAIFHIGIGGNYFFNEKFGIEFIIPFISSKNITSYYNIELYTGVGPTFGILYILK